MHVLHHTFYQWPCAHLSKVIAQTVDGKMPFSIKLQCALNTVRIMLRRQTCKVVLFQHVCAFDFCVLILSITYKFRISNRGFQARTNSCIGLTSVWFITMLVSLGTVEPKWQFFKIELLKASLKTTAFKV